MTVEQAPYADPIYRILSDHTQVSEWLENLRDSMDLLHCGGTRPDYLALESYFRRNVREHFLYEENVVFPAIETLEPEVAVVELLQRLRRDHAEILSDVAGFFGRLSRLLLRDPQTAETHQICEEVRRLVERILDHARLEDRELIPIIKRSRVHLKDLVEDASPGQGD